MKILDKEEKQREKRKRKKVSMGALIDLTKSKEFNFVAEKYVWRLANREEKQEDGKGGEWRREEGEGGEMRGGVLLLVWVWPTAGSYDHVGAAERSEYTACWGWSGWSRAIPGESV